jgi:hypothetical protein
MGRRAPLFAFGIVVGAFGCAPATVSMTMPNPARAADDVTATQSYDIPPYREDSRYEVTLSRWTPATVGFRIHLVNADRCGEPSSYTFNLVDDRGHRYPIVDTRPVRTSVRRGHLGATINDVTVDDSFAAVVDAASRYLILEVRPTLDRACTPLDFRWTFAG